MTGSLLSSPLVRSLYELVYPPVCLNCEAYFAGHGTKICSVCWSSIRSISTTDELFVEMKSRLTVGGNLSGLVSAFHFEKEGTLQLLIHELKYNEMTGVGVELGKKLGGNLRAFLGDIELAGIIPVALHPAKKRERGYNQAEFVAEGIQKVTGLPVLPSLMKRKKNTRTQTKLNLEERQENVSEAFEVNRRHLPRIKGSSFILVDDVITTGATIQECAHVLKKNGAANVYAASVALADHAVVGLI